MRLNLPAIKKTVHKLKWYKRTTTISLICFARYTLKIHPWHLCPHLHFFEDQQSPRRAVTQNSCSSTPLSLPLPVSRQFSLAAATMRIRILRVSDVFNLVNLPVFSLSNFVGKYLYFSKIKKLNDSYDLLICIVKKFVRFITISVINRCLK